jgi:hypothetical protein
VNSIPPALKRKKSRLHASASRRRSTKKNLGGAPIIDAHLMKEQQAKMEQERLEFEENKVRFHLKTEHRRKLFSMNTNADQTSSAAGQYQMKSRGRSRLLDALLAKRELSDPAGEDETLFEEDDLNSTDQYSMSFAQPPFEEIAKFDKEFNSDQRVRR